VVLEIHQQLRHHKVITEAMRLILTEITVPLVVEAQVGLEVQQTAIRLLAVLEEQDANHQLLETFMQEAEVVEIRLTPNLALQVE
jgi:hypothetical protein